MIQKTLLDCVPKEPEPKPDYSCRTCFNAKSFHVLAGKKKVKCLCSIKDFRESGCPSWADMDESKRDWIPEPLIHESEVKKFRNRRLRENAEILSEDQR